MVVLIAKNTVKEGLQQEFLKLAKEMIARTREEAGCISYDLAGISSGNRVFPNLSTKNCGAACEALCGKHLHRCGITKKKRTNEKKQEKRETEEKK